MFMQTNYILSKMTNLTEYLQSTLSESDRAIDPPFLNVPGNQFLLDLTKLFIPVIVIPFLTLVVLLVIFPETLRFRWERKRRSVENVEAYNSNILDYLDRIGSWLY
ncbi:unnamed protein product [Orchesella dallaii]|uniref:Uncharacterized protein n=1 Tax=Orchesella dallaii TaxID=48710 RepID=A0ABP1QNN4_9HEXA